ncbi:MAG TPA: DUF4232 domain-containing protein [Acidimicrobiales bacterium]|nr:DUF4232 domain-containing protein [Acidimicrobiales bacterium]
MLALTVAPGGAAAGTVYVRLDVTNEGPTTCSLDGYPSVALFGPSGASGAGAGPKLPIGTEDAGPPPQLVTLAPNGRAEFLLVAPDVPVNGAGCATVASVAVTPPGSSEALSAPLSLAPCGTAVKVYAFAPPGSESP